ncbi:MAG: VWA domain-containing protein [Deltaproteobacteria bacterium]|nr:MAG: VWA domain-containing protein [Deltaproteobacteria bacterium]
MGLTLDQPLWLLGLLLLIPMGLLLLRARISPVRRLAAFSLRGLLLAAMLLALAGLNWERTVQALGVIFVLDASDSVGTDGRERGLSFIAEALRHQGPDDQAGVVVFGATAMVEASPQLDLRVPRIESRPSPHQTDIAAGIRLGNAILPADRSRRMVVISDGEQTRGDALAQAMLTAGDDLELGVVTLERERGPEVLVEEVLAPSRVDERAPYDLRVVSRANHPTPATLRLYRNEELVEEHTIQVPGDRASITRLPQLGGFPGLHRYRAVVEPLDPSHDTVPQNNEAFATVQVRGQPRVLIVDREPKAAQQLATAMRGRHLGVDVIAPSQLPPSLTGMREWSAIILSNVPAYDLSDPQLEALEAYVRDLGRGLAMLGGDRSFGVGGYFGTPVERALPVDMDIQDKTMIPTLGMVLAIDKSCSMGGGAGSKLGMAIEASVLTIDLLNPRDQFGLVAFDHASSWLVPLDTVGDGQEQRRLVQTLRTGGGTDIYPALQMAINALDDSNVALKHVVLLSDGITSSAGFKELLEGGVQRNITTTSLAFGSDADRATMQDLATWGGGDYYLVTDPQAIPAIFTRETLLASGGFLQEEPFQPKMVARSDVLVGLEQQDFPTLFGYVRTQPKRRVVMPLVVPPSSDDASPSPLLVHGRYGLGRSLAFTSDATTRWSRSWVGTPSYTRLWSQVGRWLSADAEGESLTAAAEIREGEITVTVDAFDEAGQFLNFLEGEARVIAPDMSRAVLELSQVGPGRYRASAVADQDGGWLVSVELRQGERRVGYTVTEAVQPWSPEYRIGQSGQTLMADLAQIGGAGEITDPASVFSPSHEPRRVPVPLWPFLVALAAVLLLADVASRRLAFRWAREGQGQMLVSDAAVPLHRTGVRTATARVEPAPTRAQPVSAPEVVTPPKPKPKPPAGSYASRLLAARQRAGLRDDKQDDP